MTHTHTHTHAYSYTPTSCLLNMMDRSLFFPLCRNTLLTALGSLHYASTLLCSPTRSKEKEGIKKIWILLTRPEHYIRGKKMNLRRVGENQIFMPPSCLFMVGSFQALIENTVRNNSASSNSQTIQQWLVYMKYWKRQRFPHSNKIDSAAIWNGRVLNWHVTFAFLSPTVIVKGLIEASVNL